MVDVLTLHWFAGSSNGDITTINAQRYTNSVGAGASVEVFLLGCVEWELADHICRLHNEALNE